MYHTQTVFFWGGICINNQAGLLAKYSVDYSKKENKEKKEKQDELWSGKQEAENGVV